MSNVIQALVEGIREETGLQLELGNGESYTFTSGEHVLIISIMPGTTTVLIQQTSKQQLKIVSATHTNPQLRTMIEKAKQRGHKVMLLSPRCSPPFGQSLFRVRDYDETPIDLNDPDSIDQIIHIIENCTLTGNNSPATE